MKLILTFLFCMIALFSFCQTPSTIWQHFYGGSGYDGNKNNDGAFSTSSTKDGGSIIVGATYSTDGYAIANHGGEDILVLKLDSSGKVVWYKCLGGSSDDFPRNVAETIDGGFIIGGTTNSFDGNVSGNHGEDDAWLIKLNSKGKIEWQKCFGGSLEDEAVGGVQQTKDSGYILACSSNSSDSDVIGINHGLKDYWIVKVSKTGDIQWQKLYGGNFNEEPYNIEKTFDGGYVVIGYANSTKGGVIGFHGGPDDCWIIKLDSIGTLEWQKCIGGSNSDFGKSIKQTSDSGYIAGCYTNSNDGDVSGNHGVTDYLIIKLDKNGNIGWNNCFGGTGQDLLQDLQIAGNFYVMTGLSSSNDGNVTGNHGDYDYWTLKIDSAGSIVWETSLGGTGTDEAYSLSYNAHDGYLIGGESNSKPGGDYDFWIIKLADDNVLPVKLLSFTAQKQNNSTLLQWQIANEINNDHFRIERSPDSKLFTLIGAKQATNNALFNKYSFVDNAASSGLNYYRLKQVDKDGKFTYSNIVSVDFSNVAATFAVYPNPASNMLNVTLPSINKISDITLYDATGKETLHKQLASNITSKQIDINKLPAGIYNIVLMQDGKKQTVKIVKK